MRGRLGRLGCWSAIATAAVIAAFWMAPSPAIAATIQLVVIWNLGSQDLDDDADRCWNSQPPAALKRLGDKPLAWEDPDTGESHKVRVRVELFCKYGAFKGDYLEDCWRDPSKCVKGPKVCVRAELLKEEIEQRYSHVDPRHLFLAGQSAGAWASLLVKQAYPGKVNGVIAFAPAFAHKRVEREPTTAPDEGLTPEFARRWRWMWKTQRDHLADMPGDPLLVYAYQCDAFTRPHDLRSFTDVQVQSFPYPDGRALPCCKGHIGPKKNPPIACAKSKGIGSAPCCSKRHIRNCPAGLEALCKKQAHGGFTFHRQFNTRGRTHEFVSFLKSRLSLDKLPEGSSETGVCGFIDYEDYSPR